MQDFRILALGGGGIKGFLEIGALEELEERVGPLHEHFTEGIYGCSAGAFLAVAISFGLSVQQIKELTFKYFELNKWYGSLDVSKVQDMLSEKGIFDMSLAEKSTIEAFNAYGIPIEKKVLGDALIPLKIQASNITKGIPTIFQKNIPVLKAVLASACIPFLFRPQQINGSLYLDGGLLTSVLTSVIPEADRKKALTINIIHTQPEITIENWKKISIMDFVYKLYKTACLYEKQKTPVKNDLNLYYDKGSGISSFTQLEKEEMVLAGRTLTRNFLTERGY